MNSPSWGQEGFANARGLLRRSVIVPIRLNSAAPESLQEIDVSRGPAVDVNDVTEV